MITKKQDREIEQSAFEAFATLHPHEAYATWPGRFWKFFHKKCPHVPRSTMKAILKLTNHEP